MTLWLALSDIDRDMGSLEYAAASHKDACTYFECELPCDTVSDCYDVRTAAPLAAGDATANIGRGGQRP